MSLRLVQLIDSSGLRMVAKVDENDLRILDNARSIYDLALEAINRETTLAAIVDGAGSRKAVPYAEVYEGSAALRFLPSFDHPGDPGRCLVSGTGLTHKASADNRQAMHAAQEQETDSMRMYRWGVEGGKPSDGGIGTPPEWFYKGSGSVLRAHGDALEVPAHGEDGGEEPEIAGAYVIGADGTPWKVGYTVANEFSDHKHEKRNYLYLAPSKLRTCSIGPELCVGAEFDFVPGRVAIERGGQVIWSKEISTGEERMCHSVANMEHHHFKHAQHRRPGDAHVHFYGADAFSFGAGLLLEDGDVMSVSFEGYGPPLRNPVRIDRSAVKPIAVRAL